MSEQPRVSHPMYNLLPAEIEGFDSLAELALNLRWSWNHATDEIWRQLDSKLWEITHGSLKSVFVIVGLDPTIQRFLQSEDCYNG